MPENFQVINVGALDNISNSIAMVFLSDSVKRFNLNVVISIDNDLKMLESFADERFHSAELSELKKDISFRDCLVEARQSVNLLLSNQPENFMNPVIRKAGGVDYGALNYKMVASIYDKFKDSPDGLLWSLSNQKAKQNARMKSMDVLKRRLSNFN